MQLAGQPAPQEPEGRCRAPHVPACMHIRTPPQQRAMHCPEMLAGAGWQAQTHLLPLIQHQFQLLQLLYGGVNFSLGAAAQGTAAFMAINNQF